MEELSTTVGDDGTFGIVFDKKGTYTVDVRTNEANFISILNYACILYTAVLLIMALIMSSSPAITLR